MRRPSPRQLAALWWPAASLYFIALAFAALGIAAARAGELVGAGACALWCHFFFTAARDAAAGSARAVRAWFNREWI